jgi:hypothetical protein
VSVVLLTLPPTHWVCPNCPAEEVTAGNVANRFHVCRGLAGLNAPMIPAGSRCRVTANEREDYEGDQLVTRDGEGRPVMNVVTERDDGSNDVVVFAPTAQMKVG